MNELLALRRAAGVSQRELATLSGVAQPNIAAYESGRRRPSPRMIERFRAVLRPRPSVAVAEHRADLIAILAKHGMTAARVFGSVARGADSPGSDLDLLVDVAADADLLDLVDAASEIEELLGVHVDLITSRALGPDHEISRSAIPL